MKALLVFLFSMGPVFSAGSALAAETLRSCDKVRAEFLMLSMRSEGVTKDEELKFFCGKGADHFDECARVYHQAGDTGSSQNSTRILKELERQSLSGGCGNRSK